MCVMEKSDLLIVAMKRANKAALAAAELVERRGGAKENANQQSTATKPGNRVTGAGAHTRSRLHQRSGSSVTIQGGSPVR